MRKCFISFKKEDSWYKDYLIARYGSNNFINKTLDRWIDSEDGDYIMQVIRRDYLCDSTVTLFLIGEHSSENEGYDWNGYDKNYFIKRELAASLYNGPGNTRNGILGIVLPSMYSRIYKGTYICSTCRKNHNHVCVDDSTVVREFSRNYHIEPCPGCAWSEDDRYCVLVRWDDFISNPEPSIELAFSKRYSEIANKIVIRNLR